MHSPNSHSARVDRLIYVNTLIEGQEKLKAGDLRLRGGDPAAAVPSGGAKSTSCPDHRTLTYIGHVSSVRSSRVTDAKPKRCRATARTTARLQLAHGARTKRENSLSVRQPPGHTAAPPR